MRGLLVGRAPAHARHPFALDRAVNRHVPGEGAREPRVGCDQALDRVVRDARNARLGEGFDPMIHRSQIDAVQVREIARYLEREDLTPAVRQHLYAAGDAFEDLAALGRTVALPNDRVVTLVNVHARGRGFQRPLLLIGERPKPVQLPDQWLDHATRPAAAMLSPRAWVRQSRHARPPSPAPQPASRMPRGSISNRPATRNRRGPR